MYQVVLTNQALRQLKKLDKFTQSTLVQWLEKNLEGTNDPRVHGKGLTANHAGDWRYRVGDYCILAHIDEDSVTIEIFMIGHRRSVYDF
jgi:mRNA interferase RelE/StbE